MRARNQRRLLSLSLLGLPLAAVFTVLIALRAINAFALDANLRMQSQANMQLELPLTWDFLRRTWEPTSWEIHSSFPPVHASFETCYGSGYQTRCPRILAFGPQPLVDPRTALFTASTFSVEAHQASIESEPHGRETVSARLDATSLDSVFQRSDYLLFEAQNAAARDTLVDYLRQLASDAVAETDEAQRFRRRAAYLRIGGYLETRYLAFALSELRAGDVSRAQAFVDSALHIVDTAQSTVGAFSPSSLSERDWLVVESRLLLARAVLADLTEAAHQPHCSVDLLLAGHLLVENGLSPMWRQRTTPLTERVNELLDVAAGSAGSCAPTPRSQPGSSLLDVLHYLQLVSKWHVNEPSSWDSIGDSFILLRDATSNHVIADLASLLAVRIRYWTYHYRAGDHTQSVDWELVAQELEAIQRDYAVPTSTGPTSRIVQRSILSYIHLARAELPYAEQQP